MQFVNSAPKHKRFGRKKRLLFVGGIIATLVAILITGLFIANTRRALAPDPSPRGVTTQTNTVAPPQEQSVTFSAVGDLLAHDSVVSNARTNAGYDFYQFYDQVAPIMQKTDVRFCNQEGPVAGSAFTISGYPTFNAPKEFARDANRAGCNLINLGNNHIYDKGLDGLKHSIDTWQELKPLAVAGANKSPEEQQQVRYFEQKGIKFAFLAFAEFSNNRSVPAYALNMMDEQLMKSRTAEARKEADVVIVSMHWGTEDSNLVNQKQRDAAKLLADQGVDVIIGTGPHVLQAVENVPKAGGGDTLVWYSLGNFLSTQLEAKQLIGGIALFNVSKSNDAIKIDKVSFVPTYMHYEWTAADKAAGRLTARKNLKLYVLQRAAEPLSRSQLGTTVDAQMEYVRQVLGPVPHITETN